jgi:hypothetical protein
MLRLARAVHVRALVELLLSTLCGNGSGGTERLSGEKKESTGRVPESLPVTVPVPVSEDSELLKESTYKGEVIRLS